MGMLPESDGLRPRFSSDGPVPSRRLVAVAISADDVLDPASDLHRVAAGATEVDVLVARVDGPVAARRPSVLEAPDYVDEQTGTADDGEELLDGFTAQPWTTGTDRPQREPGAPSNVRVHRLDLRWRLQDEDEPDLVAGLSELIGFDPDADVFCVAPVGGPGDPETAVLARAVRRVALVYGLPVLRYHTAGDAGRIVAPLTRPEPAL